MNRHLFLSLLLALFASVTLSLITLKSNRLSGGGMKNPELSRWCHAVKDIADIFLA